jgi:hypothetical protein
MSHFPAFKEARKGMQTFLIISDYNGLVDIQWYVWTPTGKMGVFSCDSFPQPQKSPLYYKNIPKMDRNYICL